MANFKKLAIISSSVLATAMLTAFGVACGEEVCNHEFELKHDTEKHWYACKNDGCTLKVGEDEHIWNEGEETKAPEVGVKGEYTYTCQVCGVTETDEVPALEANPLIVAEGTVTTTNFNWYNQTITLEAGNYVVITGNEGITCDPITVYEAGETEIVFSVFDMTGDYGAEITFNYTVKKVPSITPDISNMEGEVEIVSYAWVEVSVVVPTAGRYKISSDNAKFAMDQSGSGESSYVITTTEDEEEVVFYVKATDESEEKATINYVIGNLYATYVGEGNNTVDLLPASTPTEIKFSSYSEGQYKISSYDAYATFWKDTDYNVLDSVNGFKYIETTYDEAEECYVATFYISGMYNTSFNISELTEEELADSTISWTFEEDATVAETTATVMEGKNLVSFKGVGAFKLSWDVSNVSLYVNGVEATTQSVVFTSTKFAPVELYFNNYGMDTEVTFTLTMLDDMNNLINGTVEIFVPGMGSVENIFAQLEAGDYNMSIYSNSGNALLLWNFSPMIGEPPVAEISSEAVAVTSDGAIVPLFIQAGSRDSEFVILTIESASEEEGGSGEEETTEDGSISAPYIVDAEGEVFTDVATTQINKSGMMGAWFSYTATADGVLTVNQALGEVRVDEIPQAQDFVTTDENWNSSFSVVAGSTYLVSVGAGYSATLSATFSFVANA